MDGSLGHRPGPAIRHGVIQGAHRTPTASSAIALAAGRLMARRRRGGCLDGRRQVGQGSLLSPPANDSGVEKRSGRALHPMRAGDAPLLREPVQVNEEVIIQTNLHAELGRWHEHEGLLFRSPSPPGARKNGVPGKRPCGFSSRGHWPSYYRVLLAFNQIMCDKCPIPLSLMRFILHSHVHRLCSARWRHAAIVYSHPMLDSPALPPPTGAAARFLPPACCASDQRAVFLLVRLHA